LSGVGNSEDMPCSTIAGCPSNCGLRQVGQVEQAQRMITSSDGPIVGEAERGTTLWLVRALALLRAAQLLPWLTVAFAGRWETYGNPGLVVALYAGYMCWAVVLFAQGLVRRGFTRGWVAADVALTAACVYVVGRACLPGYAITWQNWTLGPAMGAAVLTTVSYGPVAGLVAVVGLSVPYVITAWPDTSVVASATGQLLGNLASLAGFTAAAWLFAARLRLSARQADESAAAALRAQRAQAATEARFEERTRQYRLLHDTVLSTLSAIARGGLDHRTREVRERCAREAEFLRGLISAASDASPAGLSAALARVGHDQAALGLRVHHSGDAVPQQLPSQVVTATAEAVREALNNVAKHSGTKEAWVTATGEPDGSIVVTVVDRGRGFDPAVVQPGLGIAQSLRQRILEVGGEVFIDSQPGEGAYVEIRWRA
jgi:signal transduction histidine kinase